MRTLPNAAENPRAEEAKPIRNADAGNLVLMMLGLPAIPKSTINAEQDLILVPSAGTTVR
jgi:hypothetical protein